MAKKPSKAQREAQKRSAAAKRGWATRKAEARKRSDAARKGWESRRAAKPEPVRPGAPKETAKGGSSRGEPSPQKTPRGGGGGGGRTAPVAAPPPRSEPKYAPEFDDLDYFYGGEEYDEEDEY